jgi:glycosyltransferase involved in cell wall biosynthesis
VTAPRISVITPVFNAGADLERALASVAAQRRDDVEIVCVDDGSTDPATLAILDAAAKRPGVSIHRTPNRGPSAARNLAIEHARGAYVLPLDADDWLAPDYLAKTVPILDADPDVGIVHTWIGLVGGHHGVWRTGRFALPDLLVRCTLHVTSLYRRTLWADVGGYDPEFVETAEDWDFWLRAVSRGWTAREVPEVLAYYQRSVTSRERKARQPDVSGRVMRRIVTKHRALYEEHLEASLVGMYEHLAATSLTLERFYGNPAIRTALRVRDWLRPRTT